MIKGQLFSEYFVFEGIESTADYQRLFPDKIDRLYEEIGKIYFDFSKRKSPDEADTEDGLIRPILEKLGFYFSRQKAPSQKGRTDVPDFALFLTEDDKSDFDRADRNEKPWDKVACTLEAKRWNRALDRGDKTDPLDSSIPSNQILRYLSAVEVASNGKVLWGILTNGKTWRLYYHRFPSRAEGYFEIDLKEIFHNEQYSDDSGRPNLFSSQRAQKKRLALFKLFYLFFRKSAFSLTKWRLHKTFLEVALEEGRKWEERVSENLKNEIFVEVFPLLAKKGFIGDARRKGKAITDDFLEEVYENTMVFLYRLLFLFYAEDRVLLPVNKRGYSNYSLSKMRDEVADIINADEGSDTLSESATVYYDRLKNLFRIVNDGDSRLKIPAYNGELFRSDKYPFLDKFSIADKFLVSAIDMLSRDYEVEPKKRINYRDLSVRQLGSIYEGLLEFKLKVADKHFRVREVNGREVYKPTDKEEEAIIKKGEVFLTNDKSERKATGSYYTPDYIVQYIVKNSLEPLIEEKIVEFERWKNKIAKMDKQELEKKFMEYKIAFDPKVYDEQGRVIGEKPVSAYRTALLMTKDPAESILDLKVVDPAMGSGHFLVGAIDYLADRLLEIVDKYSDEVYFSEESYESPVSAKLEQMRENIVKNVIKEGFMVDKTNLDDKNLIKRILLKRCIYGVDLSPLAVELAKLSLWLHTFTVGAPLSFLDHHLKCGNSLIGSEPKDFERILRGKLFGSQYTGLMSAINMLKEIENLTDIDISEVEKSNEIYDKVVNKLEPYKRLLDLFTSELFLNPKEAKKYGESNGDSGDVPMWNLLTNFGAPLDILQKKVKSTPSGEVPLTQDEEELIQNYISLAREKRFFHWKLEFPEVWYEGKENSGFDAVIGNPPYGASFDSKERDYIGRRYELSYKNSALVFIAKGLTLRDENGYFSFIVPKSLLFSQRWKDGRKVVIDNLDRLMDFSKAFEEVLLEQVVFVIGKEKTSFYIDDTFSASVEKDVCKLTDTLISSVSDDELKIWKKVTNALYMRDISKSRRGLPFQKYLKEMKEELDLIPLYRGSHIARYLLRQTLEGVEDDLLERPVKKLEFLNQPKILSQRIVAHVQKPVDHIIIMSTCDIEGEILSLDTVENTILTDDRWNLYFITSLLNSRFVSWYAYRFIFGRAIRTMDFDNYYIGKIPIPPIDFSSINTQEVENLKKLYAKSDSDSLLQKVKQIPSNSAILHDFLSFLAQEMTKMNSVKQLLELFVEDELEDGSQEKIEVLKELSKIEKRLSNDFVIQKELAKKLLNEYEEKISKTDNLIDQVVYHLYGLSEDEIKIIED